MKKLLSILLCAALLATLTPSVFAANKYEDTLSDNTWTFSEEQDVSEYGTVGNNTNATVELVADSGLMGVGDTALKIDRPDGGSNVYINFVHNSGNVSASELKVAFDFNINSKAPLFKFVMKPSKSGSDLNVVEWNGGNIKFLNQTYSNAYKENNWYHVEMLFNIPKGYGQLKIKDYTTSKWTTYTALAGEGVFKDWTATYRLAVGVQNNPGIVCIDNYYQNKADVPAAFLGSDDFKNGISEWKYDNLTNGLTANSAAHSSADDGVALAIRAENTTAQKNAHVNKTIDSTVIANAAVDTNYHFKFKMGGDASKGSFGATLQTAGGSALYKDLFIVKKVDSRLAFWGELGSDTNCNFITQSFGTWDTSALYDVEAVYNPSSGKITAVITNADGKQLISSNSSGLLSGLPTRFAFRNCASNADNSVAYYDDFATDILDTNGPAFLSSEVLSGFASKAALDETAVFTYDRTINQAALADAVVTLNGTTLDKADYTITSKGAQVFVAVKGLEKGQSYTVGLSGVKDIIGTLSKDATDAAKVTFKTSDVDIIATQPVLNGTVLSTNVTSYYAQGKTLKLIVAVYDETESMIEAVKVATITADDRNGETLSYDFAEVLPAAAGKKVKGIVWSGFDSMTPYAEALNN